MGELVRVLTTFGREAAAIVLPSPCVRCGRELPWRDRRGSCCGRCWRSLSPMPSRRCRVCSLVMNTSADAPLCGECMRKPPAFDWIESYGPYDEGLDRVLSAFKFDGHHFLAAPLAELLMEAVSRRGEPFDLVCGVPMERARERERGYNQAELLARELARVGGFVHERLALQRTGRSETQSTLPRDERRANVRGKFVASAGVRKRAVLIVDDVCTTSETLRECARVLRNAEASRVAAVTVARA